MPNNAEARETSTNDIAINAHNVPRKYNPSPTQVNTMVPFPIIEIVFVNFYYW